MGFLPRTHGSVHALNLMILTMWCFSRLPFHSDQALGKLSQPD